MNLTDYLQQAERLSPGTVILQVGEYIKGGTINTPERRECKTINYVFLSVFGQVHQYMVKDGAGILYTIDEDGNPKAQSVFRI